MKQRQLGQYGLHGEYLMGARTRLLKKLEETNIELFGGLWWWTNLWLKKLTFRLGYR